MGAFQAFYFRIFLPKTGKFYSLKDLSELKGGKFSRNDLQDCEIDIVNQATYEVVSSVDDPGKLVASLYGYQTPCMGMEPRTKGKY